MNLMKIQNDLQKTCKYQLRLTRDFTGKVVQIYMEEEGYIFTDIIDTTTLNNRTELNTIIKNQEKAIYNVVRIKNLPLWKVLND